MLGQVLLSALLMKAFSSGLPAAQFNYPNDAKKSLRSSQAYVEYPWMALLEYTKPSGYTGHFCGGSLINSRYVVTASHCVNGITLPSEWQIDSVLLGLWYTTKNPDCEVDARGEMHCSPKNIAVPIESAIPHPQYNPLSQSQINDIALLRLKETVTFTDFVRPICLPMDNLLTDTFDDEIMEVAGWGDAELKTNVELNAKLTGVSLEKCRHDYRPLRVQLGSTQMCASGKDVNLEHGDSGGPLMVRRRASTGRNHYFLIGIISFGQIDFPCVFTKVAPFVEWMQETMQI